MLGNYQLVGGVCWEITNRWDEVERLTGWTKLLGEHQVQQVGGDVAVISLIGRRKLLRDHQQVGGGFWAMTNKWQGVAGKLSTGGRRLLGDYQQVGGGCWEITN